MDGGASQTGCHVWPAVEDAGNVVRAADCQYFFSQLLIFSFGQIFFPQDDAPGPDRTDARNLFFQRPGTEMPVGDCQNMGSAIHTGNRS